MCAARGRGKLAESGARYPDNGTAFRVLAKIAKLEVVETETFPAEDVAVFMKALV
jgi:hypothetical protein